MVEPIHPFGTITQDVYVIPDAGTCLVLVSFSVSLNAESS